MALNTLFSELYRYEMTPATLALISAVCAVSGLLAREWWSWYRLSHVPGPFLHSISIYPMNKLATSGRMSFVLKELGEKYGTTSLSAIRATVVVRRLCIWGEADLSRLCRVARSTCASRTQRGPVW